MQEWLLMPWFGTDYEGKAALYPLPYCPCCCPQKSDSLPGVIIEKGEENCGHLIEAHKECMRALGFKI
uniref:COX17 cytochrome c oxidase assembly homolog n=1 Tax=Zonotrichia albicollis TaxID=44394 RepID=A0A8D2NK50_ZONAL